MKTYFYVIEWHDGSGKTSGVVDDSSAEGAFYEVQKICTERDDQCKKVVGTIIDFKRVD